MSSQVPQQDTNIKVPFISKLAYGFGDVGCNFSCHAPRLLYNSRYTLDRDRNRTVFLPNQQAFR